MISISDLKVITTSLVSREDLQKIILQYECSQAAHLYLSVYREDAVIIKQLPIVFQSGRDSLELMLPVQSESFSARWEIWDKAGNLITQTLSDWKAPREWTWYVMLSTHLDIGLHNSQYEQRYDSSRTVEYALNLCDQTAEEHPDEQYRYTAEGTWVWNNYCEEHGSEIAHKTVRDYVHTGKLGVCAGVAGNLIESFGLEEMCRSTYEKKQLEDKWQVRSNTLAMIDVNGMPMSMIQPYAEAGYQNIIFAPNQWNPLPSTIWKRDESSVCNFNCPETGGGGSRIDIRYKSNMPMVFFWESPSGHRLLVWGSTQYGHGGEPFGLGTFDPPNEQTLAKMEREITKQLQLMDPKYPYSTWLMACYSDNPSYDGLNIDDIQPLYLNLPQIMKLWNQKWKWPHFKTLGNPDAPFDILRREHGDKIPVLRGDITGGWYQLPLSTPEILSRKFEADRLLPTAETWSTIASMLNRDYEYPHTEFARAWNHLLFNDDHSYGASGYRGRKVYETWAQHIDWIDKALNTGRNECEKALRMIASHIPSDETRTVVFNSTAQKRKAHILSEDKTQYALTDIPPLGYITLRDEDFHDREATVREQEAAPIIENAFYRVAFRENGVIASIFDKELGRELLDKNCPYGANQLLYTRDNHKSYLSPNPAHIKVTEAKDAITVEVRAEIDFLGSEIVQTISLPDSEKRLDIDNRLYHVKDMVSGTRYARYLYCAFPFLVPHAKRYCHLNGSVAEYAESVTGHGTDVYMAVNEWCCSENNDFGVALLTLDSQLTEFDHIHPDKTDYGDAGDGSRIYAYLANDWLQRHTSGGSHLDYRFRYAITSYPGGYQSAGVPQMAERYANPIQTLRIPPQSGCLASHSESFLELPSGQRLLTLKRAEDGQGLIARVYGSRKNARLGGRLGENLTIERNTIDEQAWISSPNEEDGEGFSTYRLGKETVSLQTGPNDSAQPKDGRPAPIGSVYTGLISTPRACAGEECGQIYILWGKSNEEDLSHYKLYRGETPGFEADDESFIADILPSDKFRVERYTDSGLRHHTCYYYRVRAVNQAGIEGPLSEECSAYTLEDENNL